MRRLKRQQSPSCWPQLVLVCRSLNELSSLFFYTRWTVLFDSAWRFAQKTASIGHAECSPSRGLPSREIRDDVFCRVVEVGRADTSKTKSEMAPRGSITVDTFATLSGTYITSSVRYLRAHDCKPNVITRRNGISNYTVSKKLDRHVRLMWHNFTNSQRALIIFWYRQTLFNSQFSKLYSFF